MEMWESQNLRRLMLTDMTDEKLWLRTAERMDYKYYQIVSGSSTVAIDNKIEQAMDLVKSHLMFAVREEVEVLREQIKELLEQKAQLEYENSVLKLDASSETLAKLANGPPSQPPTTSAS